MIIKGNTVGTTMPRANWDQADPTKADYIQGKEAVDASIQAAQEAADYAQDAADEAQATADDAMTAANNAQEAADQAQADADGARELAQAAQDAADDAQTIAEDAWDLANSKAEMHMETLILYASQWQNNEQEVQSRLVDEGYSVFIVTPSPGNENYQIYTECGVRCTGESYGLVFACEDVPDIDLTVNVVGFM